MRPLTRAEGAIRWIEYWCAQPDGSPVRLTSGQRLVLNQIYGPGPHEVSVDPQLAGCMVLLHLCGPEARIGRPSPVQADLFSVLAAVGPRLRPFLVRSGAKISCHALGTVWPAAA